MRPNVYIFIYMKRLFLFSFLVCAALSVSAQNPYLPLWEHVPDGEPRVFEDPDNPGKLRAYITEKPDIHLPQEILLEAMRAEMRRFPPDPEKGFEAAYYTIIEDIKREVLNNAKHE